jgi:hypothetical protein
LKFEERPDYNYMRKLLKDLMYKKGHDFDYQFDWVVKKGGQKVNMGDYADAKPDLGKLAANTAPPKEDPANFGKKN